MKTDTIKVTQNPTAPEPVEIIAAAILDIADGMKTLSRSRLSRKAIVALIHDQSKLARRDIEIVLNNLETLERDWLKPASLSAAGKAK